MQICFGKQILSGILAGIALQSGLFADQKSRNLQSAQLMHVDQLWQSPYHLSGKGVHVGVVDPGQIYHLHKEFITDGTSRVVVNDKHSNGMIDSHATHVAGTIGANGNISKYIEYYGEIIEIGSHGMAHNVTLHSYTIAQIMEDGFLVELYSNAKALNELAKNEIFISNHSYSFNEITNDIFDEDSYGKYTETSLKIDQAVSDNPYILGFYAVGNDRGVKPYGTTNPPKNAKNIFAIGAVTDGDIAVPELTSFSSTGPTLDGRIKPDFVANGYDVLSPSYDDGYVDGFYITDPLGSDYNPGYYYYWADGTSMASPAATGATALLAEQYEKIHGTQRIRADELKVIYANTAVDLGRKGPDYEYGFGLIDAKAAVDLVIANDTVQKDQITQDQVQTYYFSLQIPQNFKASLGWVDLPGDPQADKILVQDLDMWVEDSEGKMYYPFSLNKEYPEEAATADDFNHVDNMEQIAAALPAGNYTLHIKGYEVQGTQAYALAGSVVVYDEQTRIPDSSAQINVSQDDENYYITFSGFDEVEYDTAYLFIDADNNRQTGYENSGIDYIISSVFGIVDQDFSIIRDTVEFQLGQTEMSTVLKKSDLPKMGNTFKIHVGLEKKRDDGTSITVTSYPKNDMITKSLSPTLLEDFVERMYVIVLGRASEPGGMAYWVEQLSSGQKNAGDMVHGFFKSQEFNDKNLNNEAFVQVAYRALLNREAEEEGLHYWLERLDNGIISKTELINGFISSEEFGNLAAEYQIKPY